MSRRFRWIARCACVSLLLLNPLLTSGQYGPPPRDQGFVVFNSPGVRVDAGKALVFNFYVATYLRRARLAGNVVAQCGSGNDILVQVWRNQRKIFDSGLRRSVVLSIPIVEPGEYSLVLSNAFSILSAKVASGYVNLLHDGVDNQKAQIETQKTVRRIQSAQQILNQLYAKLRVDERELGTFQVPYKPSIVVTSNEDVNASASAQTNAIWINRGTFEVAESYPSKEKDILAGVIGHELAHIFYRHSSGRPTGLSIWDELVGVLPIDRVQEREADMLGVRIACQAGFDPSGLIAFMESLTARYGNGSTFGATHPQNSERIGYLKQEVRKCQYSDSGSQVEGEQRATNQLGGKVENPSPRYLTYSEFGVLRVSVPENWHELSGGTSVWFSPQGGHGQVNGQSVYSYGVSFGTMQTRQRNLQEATQDLLNGLMQKNASLRARTGYQRIYIGGRNGLLISLNNTNEATGDPEIVTFATTQLRNGALFLAIFVSPESEYSNYKDIFNAILKSVQLSS